MTIRSILCIFGGSHYELNAVNAAFTLGKRHNAHIDFLHISPDPNYYLSMYGESYVVEPSMLAMIEEGNEATFKKAKQYVHSFSSRHHVPLDAAEHIIHHASARFIHKKGYLDTIIASDGRLHDLIIIGRDSVGSAGSLYDVITASLFHTGRPVLLMPAVEGALPIEWEDKVIALAWDGGLEAARALGNAQAFVEKAEQLHIIIIREHGKDFDFTAGQGIMEYMRLRGINANTVVIDREHYSIGEAILARAKVLKSDLIVMGAYGHSRIREMILGGVTQHMINKADIPLLLSH